MISFWIKFLLFVVSAFFGGRAGIKEELNLAETFGVFVSFIILLGTLGLFVLDALPPAEYGFGFLLTPALSYLFFWFGAEYLTRNKR